MDLKYAIYEDATCRLIVDPSVASIKDLNIEILRKTPHIVNENTKLYLCAMTKNLVYAQRSITILVCGNEIVEFDSAALPIDHKWTLKYAQFSKLSENENEVKINFLEFKSYFKSNSQSCSIELKFELCQEAGQENCSGF